MTTTQAQAQAAMLADVRQWFVGEVEAGDEALSIWVDRIDSVLPASDSSSSDASSGSVREEGTG